jgi:hypothetical protein
MPIGAISLVTGGTYRARKGAAIKALPRGLAERDWTLLAPLVTLIALRVRDFPQFSCRERGTSPPLAAP